MNLDKLLNAVGKQIFVKYYNYFKDTNYASTDIVNIIEEKYTDKSKRSRIGHARMIFNKGLNIEALKLITISKVPEETKKKANEVLNNETKDNISLTSEQILLATEMLKIVQKGSVRIEYGELSSIIENKYNIHLNPHTVLPNIIGSISELCFELDLPLLSAIVVNKDTQKPGTGFYDIYDKKHDTHIKDNKILKEKILKQIKRDILNCHEWDKLTNYLGINLESEQIVNNLFIGNDKILKIIDSEEYENTEKCILSKIRIGQSDLREILLSNKERCEICGIKNKELLITSHIKPWSKSNKNEKLDCDNVLLLCSNHDTLFDKGLISFNNDGTIIISNLLDQEDRNLLHLTGEEKITVNSANKVKYLEYHRENIFRQKNF